MRRFATEMKAGGKLAGIEFGDPIKPFAAVWIHATGFNAMTYQSLLAPLGLRQRVAALDMRGHGRSTMPAKPGRMKSWHRYRDDVIEWLEREAPHGVVLSGHSMGATVALLVAGKRPDLVKGLVLADPVIMPRVYYFWKHVFPPVTWIANRNMLARSRRNGGPSFQRSVRRWNPIAGAGRSRPGASLSWQTICSMGSTGSITMARKARIRSGVSPASRNGSGNIRRPAKPALAGAQKVRKHKIPIIVLRPNRSSVITPKVRAQIILMNQALMMKGVRGTSTSCRWKRPMKCAMRCLPSSRGLVERFTLEEDSHVSRSLSIRRRRA
jgi:pimeloyl-ACP methyl ester carboxylesterase